LKQFDTIQLHPINKMENKIKMGLSCAKLSSN
jgi:hypothetical protein